MNFVKRVESTKRFCVPSKHSPFILCGEKDEGMDLAPSGRVWGISGNVVGWFVCLFACLLVFSLRDKKPFQLIGFFFLTLQGLFGEVC